MALGAVGSRRIWFSVRDAPIIMCLVGPPLPVVTYFVTMMVNEMVASRSDAPNQNFMVLSFLILVLSVVVGVCLFSFGLAWMIADRRRSKAASDRGRDA